MPFFYFVDVSLFVFPLTVIFFLFLLYDPLAHIDTTYLLLLNFRRCFLIFSCNFLNLNRSLFRFRCTKISCFTFKLSYISFIVSLFCLYLCYCRFYVFLPFNIYLATLSFTVNLHFFHLLVFYLLGFVSSYIKLVASYCCFMRF